MSDWALVFASVALVIATVFLALFTFALAKITRWLADIEDRMDKEEARLTRRARVGKKLEPRLVPLISSAFAPLTN